MLASDGLECHPRLSTALVISFAASDLTITSGLFARGPAKNLKLLYELSAVRCLCGNASVTPEYVSRIVCKHKFPEELTRLASSLDFDTIMVSDDSSCIGSVIAGSSSSSLSLVLANRRCRR